MKRYASHERDYGPPATASLGTPPTIRFGVYREDTPNQHTYFRTVDLPPESRNATRSGSQDEWLGSRIGSRLTYDLDQVFGTISHYETYPSHKGDKTEDNEEETHRMRITATFSVYLPRINP